MTPRDREFVAALCAEKEYLLENRLGPVARREGFASVGELVQAVRDRGEDGQIWAVVEAMSPAETAFFRDPGTFDLIAAHTLADLAATRPGGTLRIWSAACGAGQEIHSLVMLLDEQPPPGVSLELYGSDLCERRLEKAQAGLYSQFEVQRGLSARRLVRHFQKQDEAFVLSSRLRQMVRWRRVNLLEDLGRPGQFDLVLCRNVLGALLNEARERVVAGLTKTLAPGGYLVLGVNETVAGLASVPGRPGFHRAGDAVRAAA